MKKIVTLISLFLLASCGPTTPVVNLDSSARTSLKARIPMVLTGDIAAADFQVLKPLSATSCQKGRAQPVASLADAEDQLRHFTVQAGGNAVLNKDCTKVNGVSYALDCWTWATCKGTAIKLTDSVYARLRQPEPQKVYAMTAKAPVIQRPEPRVARFSEKPLDVRFQTGRTRPDDVAVIIANADYARLGQDIPDVSPAYADAAGVKRYVQRTLGVREGNIIHLRDATGSQLRRVFGSETDHKGQLYDWIRPNRSRVFVYYAGHGAPAGTDGTAYLVPTDSDAARIKLNGYPLQTLYTNLAKLPAASITVVLEACFSGASQAGSVITKASPVYIKPKEPKVPRGLTVISAGAANQLASWEKDTSNSLFTKYYLLGMAGAADRKPYGDGNGKITHKELEGYFADTLTYYARRYYGRDQTATIVSGRN